MFNERELVDFGLAEFAHEGVTRSMLEAYFSAWAYNSMGVATMAELLEFTDAEEIMSWYSQRKAEPPASAGDVESSPAINGGGFVGLMANLN